MYAATNSNKRILEMLVAKGADQAVRDKVRVYPYRDWCCVVWCIGDWNLH